MRLGRTNSTVVRLPAVFLYSGLILAAFSALIFSLKVHQGLRLYEDADEMEVFAASRMLAHGHHLYRDIFEPHGAVPYMITHLYTVLVSESDFSYIRLSQAVLTLISCAAVVLSPALSTLPSKIWGGSLYVLLLGCVWNLEGLNILEYDTVHGYFFVIVVAQAIVPLMLHRKITTCGLLVSGAADAIACFCAYSNGIAALLLPLSSVPLLLCFFTPQRIYSIIGRFLLGAFSATALVGLWLYQFGDIKGYFVYHFYFNQLTEPKYQGVSPSDVLRTLRVTSSPNGIIHTYVLVLFAYWMLSFAILQIARAPTTGDGRRTRFVATVASLGIMAIGVVFTNVLGRGAYADSGFLITNVALFSMAAALFLERGFLAESRSHVRRALLLFASPVILAFPVCSYANLWFGIRSDEAGRYVATMKPDSSAVYNVVRAITKEDGDLLALIFNPDIYIKANRIPASGDIFYLPVQTDYNRSPVAGYKIDICSDIRTKKPAVIWFFNWLVWNQYSIDEYEPCVLALIVQGYTPMSFDSPWFIRNDVFPVAMGLLPHGAATQLDLSPEVSQVLRVSSLPAGALPSEIRMSPSHERQTAALQRIGILFTTHDTANPGYAELRLEGSAAKAFSQRFSLTSIENNRYHYFDVDPGRYTSGSLVQISGGSIGVWESYFNVSYWSGVNSLYTCVIYEYVDGSRRYTPHCPIK